MKCQICQTFEDVDIHNLCKVPAMLCADCAHKTMSYIETEPHYLEMIEMEIRTDCYLDLLRKGRKEFFEAAVKANANSIGLKRLIKRYIIAFIRGEE